MSTHKLALICLLSGALLASPQAHADAVDTLKAFVRDVKSAQADFTQTVSSPGAKKIRRSQGQFSFLRPDHFRFNYTQPYAQLIVGDGRRVWLFDADLNQVTVRPLSQALGATPAALLAGQGLEREFDLKARAATPGAPDDLQWAEAIPKAKDGQFQAIHVGFRGQSLAALEIIDSFGQRSRLDFTNVKPNAAVSARDFEFKVPAGAEVLDNSTGN